MNESDKKRSEHIPVECIRCGNKALFIPVYEWFYFFKKRKVFKPLKFWGRYLGKVGETEHIHLQCIKCGSTISHGALDKYLYEKFPD